MSNRIAFLSLDTDFKLQKIKDGTIVKLSSNTVKPGKVLCSHAGRIDIVDGEIRYVSVRQLKKFLKNIDGFKDKINGFLVPVPEVAGPIWNDRLAGMLGKDCDMVLYELFDSETEKSYLRSWYYENVGKYIFKNYMLPLKKYAQSIGKEIIFELGDVEMQYDLMKKMIIPALIKKAGIPMAVHKEKGNVEKELNFSKDDFIINGNFLTGVKKSEDAKILLIKPTRGVMERFIQGEIKSRNNRIETPALLAGIESVYYSDMLAQNGYTFDTTDEVRIPNLRDFQKYEHILICKSCLFTEKETKRIDKLQKYGIKINDKDLMCDLVKKGEN